MEGESCEQVGGELESNIISRVFCARLAVWDRKLIPDMRWLFVCLWVCYHNNSKLRASILTKLGLQVKVVTLSSWLHFSRFAPREGVCGRAKFLARSVCVSSPPSAFSLL